MKILKDNKLYVQKNDMAYLNSSGLSIPVSIFLKVFGHGITIIDNSNRYEFIEFTDPKEIEFFQGQDWIVDYDTVKDLTEEEILQLGQEVAAEKKRRADEFNAKPKKYRQENYESVIAGLDLLDFKMYSLRDIIMFKKGELDFPLPAGVERPAQSIIDVEGEVVKEDSQVESIPASSNGKKSFLKSIFRRRNNK